MTRVRRHGLAEIPPPQVEPATGVERTRAAVANGRGRADRAAHSRPDAAQQRAISRMLGFASAMQRSERRVLGAGWEAGKLSSLQTIANKRNRIGIPPSPPTFREADATARPSRRVKKGSQSRVHRRRRSPEIGGPADVRQRNFPIRKPLKTLEMANESRRCRSSLRLERATERVRRLARVGRPVRRCGALRI